jgi:RNA 2',3'-cyclic 3'-phosphodiesterase
VRLFLGIEVDDAVKAAAAEAAARLRARVQRAAPGLAARWVSPGQLHITVWFIGEVSEPRARAIEDAVRPPFDLPPFTLSIGGAGLFPPSGRPRVFWIGVNKGGAELARIYRDVGRRLAPLGFEPERRAYSAHVTLARVKEAGGAGSRALGAAIAEVPADCGESAVAAVTLFQSRLSPRGATYVPVLRVPLKVCASG